MSTTRWKLRVLKAFEGSFEAYQYLYPKKVALLLEDAKRLKLSSADTRKYVKESFRNVGPSV